MVRFSRARLLAGIALVAITACSGDVKTPTTLADGTSVPPPVVEITTQLPQVWTTVRLTPAHRVATGSVEAACLATAPSVRPSAAVVTRLGVVGSSVTFRSAPSSGLVACDSTDSREDGEPWCARAYGRMADGRLQDPRLDLLCVTDVGAPVAFAWFQPDDRSAYIAVRHDDFSEVYPIRAGLPVRISTTNGIDVEHSSATLDVSEYDAQGAFVASSNFEARVAG